MINILVANDDGIKAEGIARLVEALAPHGNIYVAAPHIQRSASGHGITMGRAIKIKVVEFPYAKKALEVDGMPADCVKLGIKYLEEEGTPIDVVFAGINHGGNLGTDTLYSGTVSAAIEGGLCGKPSVAVSVNSHEPIHFDFACQLGVKALDVVRSHKERITLNINTPNLPRDEIKGVKYTCLGVREYEEWLHARKMQNGEVEYWYEGNPVVYSSKNTNIDVIADQEGYASVTPIKCDLTNFNLMENIEEWRLKDE